MDYVTETLPQAIYIAWILLIRFLKILPLIITFFVVIIAIDIYIYNKFNKSFIKYILKEFEIL